MADINEWLKTHADEFILYVENQGGITLQVSCKDIWDICDHSRPHASYEDAYQWSRRNDARFNDRLHALLRRYSGNLIPFYDVERNQTVDMKVYENKEQEEKQDMAEERTLSRMAKDAAIKGFKRAAVNQSTEVFLNTFEKMVGNELANQVLEHKMGREVVKSLMAMAYMYAAKNTEFVPNNANVEEICEIIMENGFHSVIEPNMAAFAQQVPMMISELTKIGKTLENPESIMSFEGFDAALKEVEKVEEVEKAEEEPAHFRNG